MCRAGQTRGDGSRFRLSNSQVNRPREKRHSAADATPAVTSDDSNRHVPIRLPQRVRPISRVCSRNGQPALLHDLRHQIGQGVVARMAAILPHQRLKIGGAFTQPRQVPVWLGSRVGKPVRRLFCKPRNRPSCNRVMPGLKLSGSSAVA